MASDRKRGGRGDASREQKLKVMQQVKSRFARFGDDVLAVVLAHAYRPSHLSDLVRRLGVGSPRGLPAQLDSIVAYVAEVGERSFVEQAGPVAVVKLGVGERRAADRRTPQEQESANFDGPERRSSSDRRAGTERRLDEERRSGRDRRSDHQRRKEVQTVSKNQRFGGDRRKIIRRLVDRLRLGAGEHSGGESESPGRVVI